MGHITQTRWEPSDGLLRSPLLDAHGPVAGFTTRSRGAMGGSIATRAELARHRDLLADALGFERVVRVRQVHGRAVVPRGCGAHDA